MKINRVDFSSVFQVITPCLEKEEGRAPGDPAGGARQQVDEANVPGVPWHWQAWSYPLSHCLQLACHRDSFGAGLVHWLNLKQFFLFVWFTPFPNCNTFVTQCNTFSYTRKIPDPHREERSNFSIINWFSLFRRKGACLQPRWITWDCEIWTLWQI